MFCSKCGTKNEDHARFCAECGDQLTNYETKALQPEPVHNFNSGSPFLYAGFWYRTLAYIIDVIIGTVGVIMIALPLGFALGASMADTSSTSEIYSAGEALGNVLGILINWLYFTISESSPWQATLGKMLLGLRVTDEAGNRISFGKANGRYWSKIFSGLLLFAGYIMVAFTEKKQGLHDKIAGTLVLKTHA